MVEQLSETMPEDVRQAFAEAIRLYSHWRSEPPNVPSPTLGFRTLKVSLSGICDLVAAYKNEPLPLAVHDELWRLIDKHEAESGACDRSLLRHRCAMSGCAHSRSPDGVR